jgi:replicative DNA helicase
MTDRQTNAALEPYIVLAQEMFRRIYADESPAEINAWGVAQLRRLASEPNENARLTWEESFAFYEELLAKRAELLSVPESERHLLTWPWQSWNQYLDPLEAGMLAVIAGADGGGKTIYAECLAEHWARQGNSVAFLHFELNRGIMLDRRMARQTGIQRRVLKVGALSGNERSEIARADDRMRTWPGRITYLHTPGWTVERALAEVTAMVNEGLCDVFIVDYLEKAAPSARQLKQFGTQIYEREADDVEQIKNCSESLGVPVVLISQLNKLGKGQTFDNLDRTAIRGSGAKTEKANVVALLYRESPESERVRVRLDKNTIGPSGSFEQLMDAPRFMVRDIVKDETARQRRLG